MDAEEYIAAIASLSPPPLPSFVWVGWGISIVITLGSGCRYWAPQQGSSSSCRTAAWDAAAQKQKRQRCQGSSSDQAGSSTSNLMQTSEPEPQDVDPANTEQQQQEEEDYYMEDDCDDADGYDEDEYEFDGAGFNQHLADKFYGMDLPPGVEATVPWLQKIAPEEEDAGPSNVNTADENTMKYSQFQQFDTVQNFTDHHFAQNTQGEPTRAWSKRIQHDWKLLEKDLPASIYVRVAEDRMDLLRAAIVGPKGTPYHDGLFFFDVHFPSSYPSGPPLVHYHSGGLWLNPNLYGSGKVCLSLLGTWLGHGCEEWNPAHSTMLQVLVSIQALILNEMPYFNEPGFEASANTAHGQQRATDYNDKTFLLSCKTMLYSLRRPPEHFADLVAGHFRVHGHTILAACKYYLEGNAIGSAVPEDKEESDCFGDTGASSSNEAPKAVTSAFGSSRFGAFKCTDTDGWGPHIRLHSGDKFRGPRSITSRVNLLNKRFVFNASLKTLFEDLLMEFNVKGADTRKFIAEKLKKKTTRSLRCAGRGFRNASN